MKKLKFWVEKIVAFCTSIYNTLISDGIIKFFCRVDRAKFLQSRLNNTDNIDAVAKNEIFRDTILLFVLAFVAALPPSGWIMWIAIVLDFINYHIFVSRIMVKLYYLYGGEDLSDGRGVSTSTAAGILAIESAAMVGKDVFIHRMKTFISMGLTKIVKFFGSKISRFVLNNIVRQLAKWSGIVFTKEMASNLMTLVVPVLCALIGGVMTVWMFFPQANKLRKKLNVMRSNGQKPSMDILKRG